VSLVQDEETGPEEETESDVEASETEKDSQALKKKEQQQQPDPNQWLEKGEPASRNLTEGRQANLFGEPPKPQQQAHQKPSQQKQKGKAEQQSLFGESPQSEKSENEKSKVEHPGEHSETLTHTETPKKETGREFGVGETIELEIWSVLISASRKF